jgi:glutamyl-tRNA synthetase
MLKTRIAPTPSGYLHAGNGASFLLTWLIATSAGGKILLRIDDLDNDRARPEYIEDIFRSLEWLGIETDEGPSGPDDFHEHWSQNHRLEDYFHLLQLVEQKGLLFGCDCTRSRLPVGPYPGTCLNKAIPLHSSEVAWRIRLDSSSSVAFSDLMMGEVECDLKNETGPFVVKSRTGRPAYQVASLSDDVRFGINFIVRGSDLLTSTACQLYLASASGKSEFHQTRFLHHPLVTGGDDIKLSKSAGSASLKSLRESGGSIILIYRIVADWLGIETNGDSVEPLKDRILKEIHQRGWK